MCRRLAVATIATQRTDDNRMSGERMDALGWEQRGDEFFAAHRYRLASECYRQAVELEPGFARALVSLGTSLARDGMAEAAVHALESACQLRPSVSLFADITVLLVHRGHYGRALTRLEEGVVHLETGACMLEAGAGDEAKLLMTMRDELRRRVRPLGGPPDIIASVELTRCVEHVWRGELDEAMRCLDRVLDADPLRELVWNNRAHVYMLRKEHALSFLCLSIALRLDPVASVTWCTLGELLWRETNRPDALACFEMTLRLSDPRDPSDETLSYLAGELQRMTFH